MSDPKNSSLLARLWFWLWYPLTRIKAIFIMAVLAAIAWGPLILRDYFIPDLQGSDEFARWDFWVGIGGTLLAWFFIIWISSRDRRARKKKQEADRLKG